VSGLISEEQLDQALSAINAETPGSPAPLVEVSDDVLAEKLVEMGIVNAWQAEHLKRGRTKFTLKDYQVIHELGQGGMGQVFKAEHPIMGRVVAIKVLPKDKSTPDALKSFHHEIRVLAQLDHPNLVRAFDAGKDLNTHFLVTEFVPGSDLRSLVRKKGEMAQRDAATVITQAAMGLQHAHEKGLIHRDVKPGNLMVTPDGKTKVLDLGLAGFLQEEIQHEDPKKGRMVGTADYLAPEIIFSPENASAASDIYSLGCTLYYAITRKVPFPGGSTAEKCHRHLHEIPLHPRRFNQDLTDQFLEVMADMMEKDPEKRIATADEVVRRLAPWADESIQAKLPAEDSSSSMSGIMRSKTPVQQSPNPLLAETQEFPDMGAQDSHDESSQGTLEGAHASEETSPALDGPKSAPPRLPPRPGQNAADDSNMSAAMIALVIAIPVVMVLIAIIVVLLLS
jgi:serine/threonine protein kinase